MKTLRGKNAVLTGGSRGLGPYIARALACEGVNVALTARAAEPLHALAEELRSSGVHATGIPGDITDPAARDTILKQARADLGPIDILINNAGLEWLARYTSLTCDDVSMLIETNFVAPLQLTRSVLPDMLDRGTGHVVTMSSLGGKKGSPYSATYAGTKAGLIEWTAGLREELRGTGVSASVICPGFVSDAGMFAVYGRRAPKLTGESPPEKVAAAVIRALTHDVGEIVVNPGPTRLMTVADAVSPVFMRWVLRTFGVYAFYRQQADTNEAARSDSR